MPTFAEVVKRFDNIIAGEGLILFTSGCIYVNMIEFS